MKPREIGIMLKSLFVIALLLAVFAASSGTFLAPDAWGHMARGRELVRDMGMPDKNSYSFAGAEKWDYSSWLFDAFIFSLATSAGTENLYLFKFFMLLLTLLMLYLVIYKRQQGKYVTIALPAALLGAYLLEPYFAVMPQVFSLLFISYFLYVLERRPRKRNKILYYSLPFMALLWSNINLSALAGVAMMIIYLGFRFLETLEEPEKKETYDFKLFFISIAATVLASLLNPAHIYGAIAFVKQFMAGSWFAGYSFTKAGISGMFLFYVYAGIMLLTMLYDIKGADVGRRAEFVKDAVLAALFFAAALRNSAFIPWFIIVSIPALCFYIYLIFRWDFVWPRQWTEADLMNIKNGFYFILVPLVFLYSGLKITAKHINPYPSGPVTYITGTQIPKNIYTEQQWAGFMEYYLYPDYQVMCDPAMEQAGNIEQDYNTIFYGDKEYRETAAKYNINSYLLDMGSPAVQYLKGPSYAAAYFDDRNIIFVNRAKTGRYFRYINPLEDNFFDRSNTLNALAELEPFSEEFPSEKAQLMVAKIYASGDASRAIDYLTYMIEKFPDSYKLYNYKGKLLYDAGDYENAYEVLTASRAHGPGEEAMLKDSGLKLKGK
jgi:hypothetical protein